jgi:hypothetical protein
VTIAYELHQNSRNGEQLPNADSPKIVPADLLRISLGKYRVIDVGGNTIGHSTFWYLEVAKCAKTRGEPGSLVIDRNCCLSSDPNRRLAKSSQNHIMNRSEGLKVVYRFSVFLGSKITSLIIICQCLYAPAVSTSVSSVVENHPQVQWQLFVASVVAERSAPFARAPAKVRRPPASARRANHQSTRSTSVISVTVNRDALLFLFQFPAFLPAFNEKSGIRVTSLSFSAFP